MERCCYDVDDGRHEKNELDASEMAWIDVEQGDRLAEEIGKARFASWDVYRGEAGAALALFRWYEATGNQKWLRIALEFIENAVEGMTKERETKSPTFLRGGSGVMAVAAAIRSAKKRMKGTHEAARAVLACGAWAYSEVDGLELFEGKCGYLQSVFFMKSRGRDLLLKAVDKKERVNTAPLARKTYAEEEVRDIGQQVIDALTDEKDSIKLPEYKKKHYFGAAHGAAGVARILAVYQQPLASSMNEAVKAYELPSKNIPSSITRKSRDLLVHWCHGAPGWVEARLVLNDIASALDAAEVTWHRGLLQSKGPGLCHGIPGNGCSFLACYIATGKSLWLRRALLFARFTLEHLETLLQHTDHKNSLFEGQAGALCFLADCLDASHKKPLTTPAPFFFDLSLSLTQDYNLAHKLLEYTKGGALQEVHFNTENLVVETKETSIRHHNSTTNTTKPPPTSSQEHNSALDLDSSAVIPTRI